MIEGQGVDDGGWKSEHLVGGRVLGPESRWWQGLERSGELEGCLREGMGAPAG